VNFPELLLYQWANTMPVAVMAVVARQILAPHDFWLMGAPLVALVGNTVVPRKHGEHRRRSTPRCRHSAQFGHGTLASHSLILRHSRKSPQVPHS
jgi:hypothetical protein